MEYRRNILQSEGHISVFVTIKLKKKDKLKGGGKKMTKKGNQYYIYDPNPNKDTSGELIKIIAEVAARKVKEKLHHENTANI